MIIFREVILGNLVSQVMRQEEFEDPIDTVSDLVDRNIIVLESSPVYNKLKNDILQLGSTEWTAVAHKMKYYEDEWCKFLLKDKLEIHLNCFLLIRWDNYN